MRRCAKYLAVVSALGMLVFTTPARAEFAVTIGNLTLAPGAPGTLDVILSSNNPSVDQLDSFGFEFQITTAGTSVLEFAKPQPDPYGNGSYIFLNDSGTQPLPLGRVLGTDNNTYLAGDFTLSGDAVNVGPSNDLLLQLSVVPGAGAFAPKAGDSFTISLVNDPSNTYLSIGGPPSIGGTPLSFTSTPGTVTFGPAAAVPEPASIVLLGVGGVFGGLYWLVSRLRAGRSASASARA
jgi:hypothetical protein